MNKFKSRFLCLILAFIMILSSGVNIAIAQDTFPFTYEDVGDGIRITGTIEGYLNDSITIPDSIDGKNVTEVATRAFFQSNLKNLILGENVHTIGDYAFAANELESVILNDNLSYIGNNAFRDNNLSTLDTKNVKTLGENAFTNNSLESINFGQIERIGRQAFSNNNLTDVYIPNSIISYGEQIFAYNNQYV